MNKRAVYTKYYNKDYYRKNREIVIEWHKLVQLLKESNK